MALSGLKVDHSGAWRDVVDAYVVSGGAVRRILTAQVRNGAVWKPVYSFAGNITTTTTATPSTTTPVAPSTAVTISGTVTPTAGAIPDGSTVELWNGAAKLLTSTTTSNAYSFSWTPTTAGVYNLTVKFITNVYYQASQVSVTAITASASSTTNVTSLPGHAVQSSNFNISGNVALSTGETATGTATAQYYNGSWITMGSAALSGGSFSITANAGLNGYYAIRVQYSGATYFTASTYNNGSYQWYPPVPGGFTVTGGALSNGAGSASISWTGSSNATNYYVYVNGTYYDLGGSTSWSFGVGADTGNTVFVLARNWAPDGTNQDTVSNTIYAYPGHPQVVNSGSAYTQFSPTAVWSYNATDGWKWSGTMFQGNHSSRNWYGVSTYSAAAIQNYYASTYGISNPAANVNVIAADWYGTRPVVAGQIDPDSPQMYFSSTTAGIGGTPNLHNGPYSLGLAAEGVGEVGLSLPAASWGAALLTGSEFSLAIYSNSTSHYSQWQSTNIGLAVTWNYVSVAQAAPYWG